MKKKSQRHFMYQKFNIPLLVRLLDIFHTASYTALKFPFFFLLSACWAKSLGNFTFLSSWWSSEWSFPVSQIPFNNCTGLNIAICLAQHNFSFQYSAFMSFTLLHSIPKLHCLRCAHATIFPAWIFP